ncbi:hypothetical protein DFH06DRAFT_1146141 [Mycena polygramma]|nr:hypothetical protein DFH06DRAFT_1152990 [Mycena polygramma]KAJ7615085.1 hypothetical protein DFH06DRAFT_1146141 [Mycena polygramma]
MVVTVAARHPGLGGGKKFKGPCCQSDPDPDPDKFYHLDLEQCTFNSAYAWNRTTLAPLRVTTLSPDFSRLPPEVLGYIFWLALPLVDTRFLSRHQRNDGTVDFAPRRGDAHHQQIPWLLGQICRHWRELAQADQRLWSWLVVAGSPFSAQIELQLARAGQMPLHICLGRLARRPHKPGNPAMLAAVIRSSERWKEATICTDWTAWTEQMEALEGHVPKLKTLHVRSAWPPYANTTFQDGDRLGAFAVAPALRTLIVAGIGNPAVSFILPWHQLTRYQSIGKMQDHINVLALCTNLVEADLTLLVALQYDPNTMPVLQMQHLRNIYVSDTALLGYLSLPALREIVADKGGEEDALLPLLVLVQRDNPPLLSISLRRGTLNINTLLLLVQQNPALQCLRLHIRIPDIPAFHDLITRLSISPGFAPTLQTMVFEIQGRMFDHNLFMHSVQSPSRAALRRVGLALSEQLAVQFWGAQTTRVAALRRAGLYFWVDSSASAGFPSKSYVYMLVEA